MTTTEPSPKRLKSASRSTSYSPPPANILPPTNSPSFKTHPTPTSTPSLNSIPYTPTFIDSLLPVLLRPPSRATKATGLRVIAPGSSGNFKNAIKLKDVDWENLPVVRWEELPLGLGDERRRFASGIAGVRLTHPGGRLEGGPGVMGGEGAGDKADVGVEVGEGGGEDAKVRDVNRGDGDVDMTGMTEGKPGSQAPEDPFAKLPKKVQDFLREHEIETQEQLQAVVKREQKEQIDELKECMREREAAKVKNEELDEKIEELVAERETERKVYERIKKARAKG